MDYKEKNADSGGAVKSSLAQEYDVWLIYLWLLKVTAPLTENEIVLKCIMYNTFAKL